MQLNKMHILIEKRKNDWRADEHFLNAREKKLSGMFHGSCFVGRYKNGQLTGKYIVNYFDRSIELKFYQIDKIYGEELEYKK